MAADLLSCQLSDTQFSKISHVLYDICGIHLTEGKEDLVKGRLMKRLRLLGLDSFDSYLKFLDQDASGQELSAMVDSLTTNKTDFFREKQHFDFLSKRIIPEVAARGTAFRIWSAGCSTGAEPYSLAIQLHESIPDLNRWDARILATDISARMLAKAQQGIYDDDELDGVPAAQIQRYFTAVPGSRPRSFRVLDRLKKLVQLARLNLMESWPMRGPFDLILCRNVMIYFDKPTQMKLVHRFSELLRPGGYLFVGHSESLTATSHDLRYVEPAVYVR